MDKVISKSILFTGFLMTSIIIIFFNFIANEVFGIEYNTYINKKWSFELQYPSDWELHDSDYFPTIDGPNSNFINMRIDNHQGNDNLHDFTQEWLEIATDVPLDNNIKVIAKPILISTGNLEMGTFLITEQFKDADAQQLKDSDNDGDNNFASQWWTILADGKELVISFLAPVNTFNSPENAEILDHLIKSLKFQ